MNTDECSDITRKSAVHTLATELRLDPRSVADTYAAAATRARARAELRAARRLSVESYPTLLLPTARGHHHRLGGPLTSVDELNTAFTEYLNRASAAPEGMHPS